LKNPEQWRKKLIADQKIHKILAAVFRWLELDSFHVLRGVSSLISFDLSGKGRRGDRASLFAALAEKFGKKFSAGWRSTWPARFVVLRCLGGIELLCEQKLFASINLRAGQLAELIRQRPLVVMRAC
jgi:hypothetical protein